MVSLGREYGGGRDPLREDVFTGHPDGKRMAGDAEGTDRSVAVGGNDWGVEPAEGGLGGDDQDDGPAGHGIVGNCLAGACGTGVGVGEGGFHGIHVDSVRGAARSAQAQGRRPSPQSGFPRAKTRRDWGAGWMRERVDHRKVPEMSRRGVGQDAADVVRRGFR